MSSDGGFLCAHEPGGWQRWQPFFSSQEDHVMEDSIFTKDEYLPPWKKSIQAMWILIAFGEVKAMIIHDSSQTEGQTLNLGRGDHHFRAHVVQTAQVVSGM